MTAIEPSTENQLPVPSNRKFGALFVFVFGLVGVWPALFGGSLRIWSLAVAAALATFALVAPSMLEPLNRIWMQFSHLLHNIVQILPRPFWLRIKARPGFASKNHGFLEWIT